MADVIDGELGEFASASERVDVYLFTCKREIALPRAVTDK